MATSDQLRQNRSQHIPKNQQSKQDDKEIYTAMRQCMGYLEDRFKQDLTGYRLEFQKQLSFGLIIEIIEAQGLRVEYDTTFKTRTIKPDGGVILLRKNNDQEKPPRIVLISEVKRQGTNDARMKEGKAKQAQGNAIERLGKNLTGIKAMLNHEYITPFVCFGWGCDFVENYDESNFLLCQKSPCLTNSTS